MKKKALMYIIIAGVLWGTSGIFFNLLEPYGFSPLQMTCMRAAVASAAMGIYVLIKDRSLFKISGKELLLFLGSGFSIFATASLYYAAIDTSSVSVAVVLMYTAPVFVMAYSVAFLGERFNLTKGVSVALMIIGCTLVSGIVGGARFSLLGVALGLSSGLAYSAYNVFTKIQMMHKSDSMSASFYSFAIMAVFAVAFCKPAEMLDIAAKEPAVTIPLMLGIGVCTCVLPYFLYTMALRDIPAGTATALGILEPTSATVFSVIFFNERLTFLSVCGIVCVLAAAVMLSKTEE